MNYTQRSNLVTLLVLAGYAAYRLARLCLFVVVVAGPWLLLLLYAATGNIWVFVAPMVSYCAFISLAVCVRSSQFSRDLERNGRKE